MKTWFTSLSGAITLSVVAFLGALAQLILVTRFLFVEFPGFMPDDQPGQVALVMLFFLAWFGGWIWALLAAARGSRRGLIVVLIFSLVLALGLSLPNILVFCGGPCAAWPVGDIIQWAGLISGLVAAAALGLQLRRVGPPGTSFK